MIRPPIVDPRTPAERAVTQLFTFVCARCGCGARLVVATPDAPLWTPEARRRARTDPSGPRRDPFAPRRPEQRARLVARLARCPRCGHRDAAPTAAHVALSILRASFAAAFVGGMLWGAAIGDDTGWRIFGVVVGLTVAFYGWRIVRQDAAVFASPDLAWSDVVGGRS